MNPALESPPDPGWCLRFLNGAMKGRTIALKPGANVVGASGDCDIMLPGSDVLPRHLVFTAGELVVSVQKIGTGALKLNRDEMAQPRRSLATGDVIGVGEIELQLERSYPAARPADPMFASADSAVPGHPPLPALPVLGRPAFRAGAALLVLACAGVLGVALWAGGEDRPQRTRADLIGVENALKPFRDVETIAAPGGHVLVKGFVESRPRKLALAEALRPFGEQVSANVYATDELVEQARRYLGTPGVAVDYGGQGRLVLTGASDDEALPAKVRRLGQDLHPAVMVLDKVRYRPPPPVDREAASHAQWAAWQELLPARLVSITDDGHGLRSIQLANGNRYYEGSVLKSGAEITRIDADGLVLSSGKPGVSR